MNRILLIARREIHGYLSSPLGYIIVAALLLIDGVAFNALAMADEKKSFDVLYWYFFFSCGIVAAAGVLFSMRLFAEERQTGTIVLLTASPASEGELVVGKFLGGFGFLAIFIALASYMPLLVVVNGRVSVGHLMVGYLGLLLEGAAIIALGTLMSALTKSQLLAAVTSAVVVVFLFVSWFIAKKVDGPLGDVIGYLSMFDSHFVSAARGVLKLSTVVYTLSLTYIGLHGATLVLASRRWRG
jgi:ABC-2 type transport system permease protein